MTAPIDRAALRALLDAATPLPWGRGTGAMAREIQKHTQDEPPMVETGIAWCDSARWTIDAPLIVAAVNALPGLLDALDAAERRAESERMRADMHATQAADLAERLGLVAELPTDEATAEVEERTIARLRRERDEARADVLRFGLHGMYDAPTGGSQVCPRVLGSALPCRCGYDDARKGFV